MANLPVEFSINVLGETTGASYSGVFKARPMLSHRGVLFQDQRRRDLLGTNTAEVSPLAEGTAQVFAYIDAHLTEAPAWWGPTVGGGLDLLDDAPVKAVQDEIVKLEERERETIKKAGAAAMDFLKNKVG